MKAGPLIRRILMISSIALFAMGMCRNVRADQTDVHRLIADAVNRFNAVEDYTCRLDKTVRKKGRLYEDRDIFVKYKKPSHYYFRWNSGLARGREVIYVQGRHDDKIVAHPGGIFKLLTLHLDPEGYLAMKENRHCLKSSGMEKIIALVATNAARAKEKGLEGIHYKGEGCFDGKRVRVVEGLFPEHQGFYASRIVLYLCPALQLPLKVSIYDGAGELVEDYAFHDLRINVGLSEDDFEPHNRQYNFMRP